MTSHETDSKLVSFLYTLLRDELPAGTVEGLVRDATLGEKVALTNGNLAKYAVELAERLTNDERTYEVVVGGVMQRISAGRMGLTADEVLNLSLAAAGRDLARSDDWEIRDNAGHIVTNISTAPLPFYVNLRAGWGG